MRKEVRTADGRVLTAERWGDPDGRPVFLLHGMPGSRLGPAPRGMVLYQRRTQLIAYDRPGYGGSGRHPGRSVADVAHDVAAVADAFGLDTFAVAGRSGGAPGALACAALLPERVTRTAALVPLAPRDAEDLDWFAGMAASNVREYTAATDDPEELAARLIPRAAGIARDPGRLLDELRRELTASDRMIVSDAGLRSMLLRNYREGVRASAYGWIDDILAFSSPWGFDPAGIRCPVLIWHGELDVFSPVGHARWLGRRIPGATTAIDPDAAHFAALRALPDVLTWLLREPLGEQQPA
ncbi:MULTISPECIES: alpha/beta fold hydrolase [Streptomyces]|uniref:alpha/beta fold hydrolase n=1 Tax=Streptomyces TaxID=1883 RepID=UPI000F6CE527|nr:MULTISPECIES: alpha/beta hydrolase [unclassified Streptomyces]AZM88465.1 alpha/beta hydrolase [Streptomyces sp. W1SF4]RSS50678.1 alpha/beta hydrolase [Streptomyces sp. WAC07061]